MTTWTLAREILPNGDLADSTKGLPERYQTFVIKRDGEIIGRLKHAYRPKNAGGPAWCAYLDLPPGLAECVTYYGTKENVLNWVKTHGAAYRDREFRERAAHQERMRVMRQAYERSGYAGSFEDFRDEIEREQMAEAMAMAEAEHAYP